MLTLEFEENVAEELDLVTELRVELGVTEGAMLAEFEDIGALELEEEVDEGLVVEVEADVEVGVEVDASTLLDTSVDDVEMLVRLERSRDDDIQRIAVRRQ